MTGGTGSGLGDIHSHMIPGVDDGVRDVEQALDALGRLVDEGVTTVVTTPHLDASLTLDATSLEERLAAVDGAWDEVRSAAAEAYPALDFHRGHELAVDVPDPDLGDERLRLAGTDFVLVEWPRFQIPPGTVDVVSRLVSDGYRPIIAHPERYAGLGDDVGIAGEWRRAGAHLQVNHGSVGGRYGSRVRQGAVRLLERGWVDYLSTDFHGHPGSGTHLEATRTLFEESGSGEAWRILTGTNPCRVPRGEAPLPVTPLEFRKGIWGRIMGVFGGDD